MTLSFLVLSNSKWSTLNYASFHQGQKTQFLRTKVWFLRNVNAVHGENEEQEAWSDCGCVLSTFSSSSSSLFLFWF